MVTNKQTPKSVHAQAEAKRVQMWNVIKRKRGEMDLTWGDVAKIAGVTPMTLKRWRDGGYSPSLESIQRIVYTMEIPPEEIAQYII